MTPAVCVGIAYVCDITLYSYVDACRQLQQTVLASRRFQLPDPEFFGGFRDRTPRRTGA